ncbi:hypothetical protein ABZ342_21995 [Amycolatopsis sp. NPDC005961]|uniref:hypothetical protein n=1 Tax=Amycolatopsis sp. NPDC005961 TaxID=3156720 RepID=UPI0033C9BC93
MTNLTLDVALKGRNPMSMVLPAQDVISTNLVVSPTNPSLPTLTSVERINSRISDFGIVLDDRAQLDRLAKIVNVHYLSTPRANWVDTTLRLSGELVAGEPDQQALRAVRAVRAPTLHAAETLLHTESSGNPLARRPAETELVDSITSAVQAENPVWKSNGAKIALYIGKTLLDMIITQIIGVPLVDILRHAVAGIGPVA